MTMYKVYRTWTDQLLGEVRADSIESAYEFATTIYGECVCVLSPDGVCMY